MNTTPARFALVVGDWFDGETRRGPATLKVVDGCLAGVAEDDLVDDGGLDSGAPQAGLGHVRAEVGRGEPGQPAAEFPDRCAHWSDQRQPSSRSAPGAQGLLRHYLAVNCGVRFSM